MGVLANSTLNASELVLYTLGKTAGVTGGVAVQALAIPCIRNGIILAGSAHTMRHFGGLFAGIATLLGESAILYATGSSPISSIAAGVGLYYLPKGLEVFAQQAISKTAFLALDAMGKTSWYLASKGAGLAALGVGSVCKLLQSKPSSQKIAPTIAVSIPTPDVSKKTEIQLVEIQLAEARLTQAQQQEEIEALKKIINQMSAQINLSKELQAGQSATSTTKVISARSKKSNTTATLARSVSLKQQASITPRRSIRLKQTTKSDTIVVTPSVASRTLAASQAVQQQASRTFRRSTR